MLYRISIIALMAFGLAASAWAATTPQSITVTYDEPAKITAGGSVKVMNAYHLDKQSISTLSQGTIQAITKGCGNSGPNINLISKSVGDQEVLECSDGKALNIQTSDVVMSTKSCGWLGCS